MSDIGAVDFNPHFRKGSDCYGEGAASDGEDFNPHFRKGSDEVRGQWQDPSMISIHTSAREVTVLLG